MQRVISTAPRGLARGQIWHQLSHSRKPTRGSPSHNPVSIIRSYARPARSPSAMKSSRTNNAPGSSRASDHLVFKVDDIPPPSYWERAVPVSGAQDLTPADCIRVASEYVSVAARGSSKWIQSLRKDGNLDPYELHYISLMLISGPPSPTWQLGLHMLGTASELGYAPSTLTMMRLKTRAPPGSSIHNSSLFRSAEARFQELVKQRRDPDALTLQGILLAAGGDPKSESLALRWFEAAEQAGGQANRGFSPAVQPGPAASPETTSKNDASDGAKTGSSVRVRPFRWNWEASCYLGHGRILCKQGKLEEAKGLLQVAALELDNAEGFLELAKLLPQDDPQRMDYLLKAAVSGTREACQILAEEELRKSKAATSRPEKEEHEKWAREWRLLATHGADGASD